MVLKKDQKRGIGVGLAGIGALLSVASLHVSKGYEYTVLVIATLFLIAGVILTFKNRK